VTDIEDLTLNDLLHTVSSSVTSTLSHAATHTAVAAVAKEIEPTATEPTVTEPKEITAEQEADNNRDTSCGVTRCGVGSGAAHQLSHRPPQQEAEKEEGDQIGGLLACVAHGYVFDLATGHCISETPRPCATARTYGSHICRVSYLPEQGLFRFYLSPVYLSPVYLSLRLCLCNAF